MCAGGLCQKVSGMLEERDKKYVLETKATPEERHRDIFIRVVGRGNFKLLVRSVDFRLSQCCVWRLTCCLDRYVCSGYRATLPP